MRGRSTAAATTTVGGYGSGMAQRQVVGTTGVVGMQVHRPESARNYLLRSFETAAAPAEDDNPSAGDCGGSVKGGSPQKGKKTAKKMTARERDAEREENLGLLLGALRLLYDSWADHLSTEELDRRAWSWYVAVRPAVESGPSGWGAKGLLRLQDILDLRRKEQT
ncbi:hypothetical protein VTK73DRAFT_2002 [Phialemonium thermophilum]|uniref:Uncharacterized protein n=1 Tax=Phialemonium thermophilum TaxID=223376 RepID=A0ABR3VSS5_9PEZI